MLDFETMSEDMRSRYIELSLREADGRISANDQRELRQLRSDLGLA